MRNYQFCIIMLFACCTQNLNAQLFLEWDIPVRFGYMGLSPVSSEFGYNLNGETETIGYHELAPLTDQHIDLQERIVFESVLQKVRNYHWHSPHVIGCGAGNGNMDELAFGVASKSKIHNSGLMGSMNQSYLDSHPDVRIHQHSYGGSSPLNYTSLSVARDLLIYNNWDLLDVHGAGNKTSGLLSGTNTAKNVLTVGAAHLHHRANPLRFNTEKPSGYPTGPTIDGRLKPEITSQYHLQSQAMANSYLTGGGSSEANPMVAAGGSLMRQKYKEDNGDAIAPGGLLKAILCNTATDIESAGPDYASGFGVMNVYRAVQAIEDGRYFGDHDTTYAVSQDESANFVIDIPSNVNIAKIMLYWVDINGELGCTDCLINDLDLSVSNAAGDISYPLILDPNDPTKLAEPADYTMDIRDSKNNIEQVTLINPDAGSYTINVHGFEVPEGAQGFYVTYEFYKDELEIIYPFHGDKLISDRSNPIAWDCYRDELQTFKIEVSTDGGNTYAILDDNYAVEPNETMTFPWSLPVSNTGEAKIRITRTSQEPLTAETENFTISNRIQILNDEIYLEDGAASFSWTPIENAVEYEILKYALGDGEPIVIANTSETQFTVTTLNDVDMNWLSVRPVFENGNVGIRSISERVIEELVYVRQNNSSGIEDGKSWATAFRRLDDAIFLSPAKEYRLAEGYYVGRGLNILRFDTKILGGFPNSGEPELEDRNPQKYHTKMNAKSHSNSWDFDREGYNDALLYSERDLTVDGIYFSTTNGNSGANNYITHNSRKAGGKLNVFNCTFYNSVDFSAIHSINTGTEGLEVHIDNCLFAGHPLKPDNSSAIIIDDEYDTGDSLLNHSNVLITNCSFSTEFDIGQIQYNSQHPESSLDIYNSVIWGGTDVVIGYDINNVTIDYSYLGSDSENFNYGAHNIISSEIPFTDVSPATADYTPGIGSPIIDAGSNAYLTQKDLNWIDRPLGGITDMGAFEHTASATVIYVHDHAQGNNNGTSWADAFTSLRQAVNSVANGCASDVEIWVAEGTYYASDVNNRSHKLLVKDCTSLYGGFPDPLDSGIINPTHTDRKPKDYVSILSGDINVAGEQSDNTSKILEVSNIDNYSKINGFTIQDVYNDGSQSPVFIRCSYGRTFDLFFSNNILTDNLGFNGGSMGIVAYSDAVLNVHANNLLFTDNYSNANGAALFVKGQLNSLINLNLSNAQFQNNYSNRYGGAIYLANNQSSTNIVELENSIFESNQALYQGGAVYSTSKSSGSSNTMHVSNVKFWENSTVSFHGGAFSLRTLSSATNELNVHDSEFMGNDGANGGVIYSHAISDGVSNISLSKTVMFDNNARSLAGTLYLHTGTNGLHNTSLDNCLSYNNINLTDPGILMYTPDSNPNFGTSNLDIRNSTFYQQSQRSLRATDNASSYNTTNSNYVDVKNSIFINEAGDGIYKWSRGEMNLENNILSNSDCNPTLWTCGNIQFDTDPLFVDVATENFELQESSSGINAGLDLMEIEEDLLGIERPIGITHDIGCYEYPFEISSATIGSAQSIVQNNALLEARSAELSEKAIKIYPNPSEGVFTLESRAKSSEIAGVKIVDLNGRLVYLESLQEPTAIVQMNLQEKLVRGMYFVQIRLQNGEYEVEKIHIFN